VTTFGYHRLPQTRGGPKKIVTKRHQYSVTAFELLSGGEEGVGFGTGKCKLICAAVAEAPYTL